MEVDGPRLVKPASDRRPFLTLVEREYLKQMANIPAAAWEPISYLYSEADSALERLRTMYVAPEKEVLRQQTQEKWHRVLAWLDHLMQTGVSVKALRSWQIVSAFQNSPDIPVRPGSTIVPVSMQQPQVVNNGKRGVFRRR